MIVEDKTKEELENELAELQKQVADLEKSEIEHKQVEETLRESEGKFRDLTEKSLVGVYLIRDGVFKYVNPRLADIFGYKVEEIIDRKTVEDLVFPEDWPVVGENLRRRISGEIDSIHYGFRGMKKNKEPIYVEVYGSRTVYDGQPAIIGTLLDLTEHKRVEDALRLSEEQYRTMIEQSNDMIWTLDTEGNFTFFNQRSEEISGYRFEDWQGRTFAPLIVEEDLPHIIEAFGKTLKGEPQHYEVRIRKEDGSIFILSVNTASIFKGTEVVGTVSFGRDITNQRQAEEKLKMEAQLLDAATDSIMVHDLEGNFVYVNEAACRSLGYSKDELMRMNLRELDTPEYAKLIEPRIKKLLETGEATFESANLRKDGSIVPVEVHARIIESGGRKLVLGVSRDIAERKEAEGELQNSLDRLRKSLSGDM